MSRLNLNWSLSLRSERSDFINTYIKNIPFAPTDDELEMMGNYILWGKITESDKDGPSRLKKEGLYISTRANDWNSENIESLDELIETPGFTETQILSPETPPLKQIKQIFSRDEARKLASPELLNSLESLWRQIDKYELIINYYDLAHNRRKTPIRDSLLAQFTEEEQIKIQTYANSLKQYTYLKIKHQLIELRQQQYTYQDFYKTTIFKSDHSQIIDRQEPILIDEENINFLPFSIPFNHPLFPKLFNPTKLPNPTDFNENELKELSNLLWAPVSKSIVFDFSNQQHLYQLFNLSDEFYDDKNIQQLYHIARIYAGWANLEPFQLEVLELKFQKKSNQDIVNALEQKYEHKYQLNYISTIYCKKVLAQIAATALYHREICENLFFPENFKRCKDCGKILLLTSQNWMRRHRSNDGFAPRCKQCDKIKRNGG